jgi:hypothetical protein
MSLKQHRTWRDRVAPANEMAHQYWSWKHPKESDHQKHEIENEADAIIQKILDHPEGRFQLQEKFYEKYGFGEEYGYGNSAISFLRWEISRGVLNPLKGSNPGSPWWRKVNADFLRTNIIGELVFEANLSGVTFSQAVQFWLAYLRFPTARSWYKAHNSSIAQAYLDAVSSAKQERTEEQIFMNEVLSRVLYAQAMVNGKAFPLGCLGSIIANSKLPAVKLMVHLPAFYPDNYPLTGEDIRNILHDNRDVEDDLVKILDDTFVHHKLKRLYTRAATWLSNPNLVKLVREDKMIYPNIS